MTNDLILIYSGFFICCIILSILLNGLLMRFSSTMGVRANPDMVRWSTSRKPAVGGISFFVIFLFALASRSVFFPFQMSLLDKPQLGMLGAVTLAFVMGLADDAYNTKPFLKLGVQITCGLILNSTGQTIHFFSNETANELLTVIWVVGIMNSINLLDNMDAIAASVSLFILLEGMLILYIHSLFYDVHVIILLGTIGAIGGFLFFNWNPSKLYMGDTGSQFLGILLAIVGIHYFWNSPDFGQHYYHSKQIIVTMLAFIIPIADTTTVFINRIMRKQAPWVGGRDHTTHHLSYLGLSDSQVAIAFTVVSIISLMLIFLIQGTIVNWGMKHVYLFGGYIALVFGTLYAISRYSKPPAKKDEEAAE
jgi:UDP-GlcNAc:undecaprenyl-phosphate/decaprenyl-phosphate GlcNAc-1-phosphate transferase